VVAHVGEVARQIDDPVDRLATPRLRYEDTGGGWSFRIAEISAA
jgi:hypothetical protein